MIDCDMQMLDSDSHTGIERLAFVDVSADAVRTVRALLGVDMAMISEEPALKMPCTSDRPSSRSLSQMGYVTSLNLRALSSLLIFIFHGGPRSVETSPIGNSRCPLLSRNLQGIGWF